MLNVHPDYISFDSGPKRDDEYPVAHYAEFLVWVKQQHSPSYWHALPLKVVRFIKRQLAAAACMVLMNSSGDAPLRLVGI